MNITIFGASYVGLVTGAVLADIGHQVTLVDVLADKVDSINQGIPPFFEPGLNTLTARVVQKGNLVATHVPDGAIRSADIIFIAVGTPAQANGDADLSYVRQAAMDIGRHLGDQVRPVVVNKATVPIGCGNLVEIWIQDGFESTFGQPLPRERYAVASNPEFLREGSAIHDTLYPDRIVVGTDEPWAQQQLDKLYEPILAQTFIPPKEARRPNGFSEIPLVQTDRVTAEMIKYAANAFLATKISFANEVANISCLVGANVNEVVRGMGLDSRIGPKFLRTGIGWGGSCFSKDISELTMMADQYGYQSSILQATVAVNRAQRRLVVKKLQEALKTVKGRRIAIWGLAFKPGTDDLRDAPAVSVIEHLLRLGARIHVYDPVAMPALRDSRPDLEILYDSSPEIAIVHADALILTTEWPEFERVPLDTIGELMANPVVIDGRRFWDPPMCRQAGLAYYAIGQ